MASTPSSDGVVAVIGLGRFGSSVADHLVALGHEVLAVDRDGRLVQSLADRYTHLVEADSTSEVAMRQIGMADIDRAVVGIGTHLEPSVLTVSVLGDLGVQEIWAKATTRDHGRILERIGAHHVIYPEHTMGERVAHLVTGKMMDFIEFDDGFAIVKTRAPEESVDRTLAESALRSRYGVTVVGVKSRGLDFTYARPETVVRSGDLLIVSGPTRKVEHFAGRT